MAHLTLSVLGEFQALIDGVPIASFESDKVRALLVYLAVEANRTHRRETLIGLLWPDCPEQAARHNLRQALFNLRLALGDHMAKPPYFLITRDAIQFNQESDYSLDLALFNRHFDRWEKNRRQESEGPSTFVTQLEETVNLYRGEFLQQFYLADSAEFEEWILVQREASHQRAMNALTYLANNFEQLGDFQTAHRYALRQLELDPWREEAHCQIMRVLALDGQRSAALAQYENCRRILAVELGVEPSTTTRDLSEQIRQGMLKRKTETPSHVAAAPIHNLPIPLTPFIGREAEMVDLSRLIADPQCRCITLVGPGGIGKTRLALQAADQHKTEFAYGSAFVPLAAVGTIEAVIPAMASAIDFAFSGPSDPKVQLLNHLREKQMLLILDNAEHLLVERPHQETIAELLIEVLRQAAQVKLLVTSREALNLQGEWPFEVEGLSFPEGEQTELFDEYSAVALFIQRAKRVQPRFEIGTEDKTGVAHICRLVEGMPLAIELAATWVRILSPAEIAAEIEHSLDFLDTSMRDLPERHRSMRAVFDRSWQTLSADEKHVLGRLSVFRGGFGRHAAEQVADASLAVLSSLVIRSLLRRTSTGRYDLHELVRQYAATKLAETPDDLNSVQERHSLYYLGLLEEQDAKLNGRDQKRALAELTREMDNIRTAWDWSIAAEKFIPLYRASTTLWYLFELRNWFKEGEVTFHKTADALQASMARSEAVTFHQIALNAMLAHCGYFRFRLGRGEEAYAIMSPSATFLRTSAEPSAAIYSLWYLGLVCWQLGRFLEAKEYLQESLALTRQYGDRWYEALAGEFLGSLASEEGAYNHAQQYLQEALAIFRELGDPMMISHGLSDLGRIMQILGELDEAEKLLRESFELARELDCRFGMGLALDVLGQVAHARASHEEARALFSESAGLFQEIGDTHRLSQVLNHQGLNALALEDTAEAQSAFKAALRMAHKGGLLPSALDALMGVAALDTQRKATEETLTFDSLHSSASGQRTRNEEPSHTLTSRT